MKSGFQHIICVVVVNFVLLFTPDFEAKCQTAESLSQVKKIFVDSLGTEQGATEIRNELIKALQKNKTIQIVKTATEADAIVKGTGKIWVTGSVRVGIRGSLSQATYDGYLQAELRGKGDRTLWSQLVTPSKFPWNGIVPDLAGHFAKYLAEALRQNKSLNLADNQSVQA